MIWPKQVSRIEVYSMLTSDNEDDVSKTAATPSSTSCKMAGKGHLYWMITLCMDRATGDRVTWGPPIPPPSSLPEKIPSIMCLCLCLCLCPYDFYALCAHVMYICSLHSHVEFLMYYVLERCVDFWWAMSFLLWLTTCTMHLWFRAALHGNMHIVDGMHTCKASQRRSSMMSSLSPI